LYNIQKKIRGATDELGYLEMDISKIEILGDKDIENRLYFYTSQFIDQDIFERYYVFSILSDGEFTKDTIERTATKHLYLIGLKKDSTSLIYISGDFLKNKLYLELNKFDKKRIGDYCNLIYYGYNMKEFKIRRSLFGKRIRIKAISENSINSILNFKIELSYEKGKGYYPTSYRYYVIRNTSNNERRD